MTNTTENTRAKVIYRNTVDEKIEVLRFENVLDVAKLQCKFGEEVVRLYLQGLCFWERDTNSEVVGLCNGMHGHSFNLKVGLCEKEDFAEKIKLMKQAGKRLGEIRKQVEEEKYTKEHVITI